MWLVLTLLSWLGLLVIFDQILKALALFYKLLILWWWESEWVGWNTLCLQCKQFLWVVHDFCWWIIIMQFAGQLTVTGCYFGTIDFGTHCHLLYRVDIGFGGFAGVQIPLTTLSRIGFSIRHTLNLAQFTSRQLGYLEWIFCLMFRYDWVNFLGIVIVIRKAGLQFWIKNFLLLFWQSHLNLIRLKIL